MVLSVREESFGETLAATLTTWPLHTNGGCGKERSILIGPW